MSTKKSCIAACPISYRPSSDFEQKRRNILGYIFSGYETCDDTQLRDVCIQTDVIMSEWDDQHFQNILDKFSPGSDVGDSQPVEEFADIIESGDEEYHSVMEDKLDKRSSATPYSINIELKDSPHVILKDGTQKTKISLTSKYLEENGLELIIGEGSSKNVKLKIGDTEIYPSEKEIPPDINITVTDDKNPEKKDAEVDRLHERGENNYYGGFEGRGRKLGLMSLVVDNLEQQNNEQNTEDKFISYDTGGNVVQCISDYGYLKKIDKREVGIVEKKDDQTLGKIQRLNAEMIRRKNSEVTKRQEKEIYKRVKKKFFKSVLEGDPRMDYVKKELVGELVRRGYEAPVKEKFKSTEAQTDVQIDPRAHDDYSFSDDSDSILRRFNALRDFSASNSSPREPPQVKDKKEVDEKKTDQTNTHDATLGQLDTDFSTRTEPTMEGISDLTDRNVVAGTVREREDATDDDLSDISTKPKNSPSWTNLERRTKSVDTQDLENERIKDLAIPSDRQLNSPSLLKALRSFDEELSPLNQELNRLLSDFKSIDIPEDVQSSAAAERLPELPPGPSTSGQQHFNPEESYHQTMLSRAGLPHPAISTDSCHCAPGTCLGFGRASGIVCRRIKRLPPSASSSEFFREFSRPDWISGSFRPHSILSEPEDIYGDRINRRHSSSMSVPNEDIDNKQDSS